MQHSENVSPIFFLSVPVSRFLPFSKFSKQNRIILGVFSIWVSILEYIPLTYSGSWTKSLKVIWLCFHFGSAWSGWTVIMSKKPQPDCLWDAVSRYLKLIFFPLSSKRPESFKVKVYWLETSMVWTWTLKSLFSPFSTWVFTRDPMSKKWSQSAQTVVVQYPPPLEISCIIEL